MTKLLTSQQEDLLQRCTTVQLNEFEEDQVTALLTRLVNGELDEESADRVMEILGEHEQSLDRLEAIWLAQPISQAFSNTVAPDNDVSRRLRGQIIRAIHRANTAGAALTFGVKGFGAVAGTLLRPFIKRNHWQSRRQRWARR